MPSAGYEIRVKNSKWSDVKLVCACNPDADTEKAFSIIPAYQQIQYKCTNPECKNMFPVEIQLKILTDVEKWLEKHNGDMRGFDKVFYRTLIIPLKKNSCGIDTYGHEKCKMRARYLKTITVGKIHPRTIHIIEVSNITLGIVNNNS